MEIKNLTFDVGGMGVKVIYFNPDATIIKEDAFEYHYSDKIERIDLTYVLNLLVDYINKFSEKINVGICFPGIIDFQDDEILSESFLVNVKGIKIKEFITKKCPQIDRFAMENDAKSAALGEYHYGSGGQYQDFLLLTIGSGIGGGLILNSQLRNGAHFLAGELSKMYADLNKEEFFLLAHSGSTMVLRYKYAKLTNQDMMKVSGKEIMNHYDQGDELAIKAVQEVSNALARALVNVMIVVDVEAFLIGGGISASESFIKELNLAFDKYLIQQDLQNFKPEIVKCKLENKAGCYGMLYKLTN